MALIQPTYGHGCSELYWERPVGLAHGRRVTYLKHEVGTFLMLVECKKRASDQPVGIDVIQRLFGIQQMQHANKALIVTTSFFTPPAKSEVARHNGLIDLKNIEALRQWLNKYRGQESPTSRMHATAFSRA